MLIKLKGQDPSTGASPEHVKVRHDSAFGFVVHIGRGEIHIRAKARDEADYMKTTILIDPIAPVTGD